MPNNCDISFDRLVDFVVGELGEEESERLQDHLRSGCQRCRKGLEWVHRVVRLMQVDDSAKPPSWLVRRVVSLFVNPRTAPASATPLLARALGTRLTARLVYDSRLAMPAYGVRAITTPTIQMLYSAGDLDVDVRIVAGEQEGESTLVGQALPVGEALADVSGAEVVLVDKHGSLLRGNADAFGQFAFTHLAAGTYDLRIRVWNHEVEARQITF